MENALLLLIQLNHDVFNYTPLDQPVFLSFQTSRFSIRFCSSFFFFSFFLFSSSSPLFPSVEKSNLSLHVTYIRSYDKFLYEPPKPLAPLTSPVYLRLHPHSTWIKIPLARMLSLSPNAKIERNSSNEHRRRFNTE